MFQMSKEDAIQFLHEAKERLSQAKTKEETLEVLRNAAGRLQASVSRARCWRRA